MPRHPLITDTGRAVIVRDAITEILAAPPNPGQLRFATQQNELYVGTTTGWLSTASASIIEVGPSASLNFIPKWTGTLPPFNRLTDSQLREVGPDGGANEIGIKSVVVPLGPATATADPTVATPVDSNWIGQMYFNTTTGKMRVFVGPTATDWQDLGTGGGGISGSGTAQRLAKFTAGTVIGDSRVYEGLFGVGVNAAPAIPSQHLYVQQGDTSATITSFVIQNTATSSIGCELILGSNVSGLPSSNRSRIFETANVLEIQRTRSQALVPEVNKLIINNPSASAPWTNISSDSKGGFRIVPQSTRNDAVSVEGVLFADSTDNKLYYHTGSLWVDLTAGGTPGVTGSGTANTLPLWTAGTVLGDSRLSQLSNGVGINGTDAIIDPNTALAVHAIGTTTPALRVRTRATGAGAIAAITAESSNGIAGYTYAEDVTNTGQAFMYISQPGRIQNTLSMKANPATGPNFQPLVVDCQGGLLLTAIPGAQRLGLGFNVTGRIVSDDTDGKLYYSDNTKWIDLTGNVKGSGTVGRVPYFSGTDTLSDSKLYEGPQGIGINAVSGSNQHLSVLSHAASTDVEVRFTANGASNSARIYLGNSSSPVQGLISNDSLNGLSMSRDLTNIFKVLSAGAGPNFGAIEMVSSGGFVLDPISDAQRTGLNARLGRFATVTGTGDLYYHNGTSWINLTAGAGGVGGSGTTNTIPLWTAGTTLGDSLVTQISGTNAVISLTNSAATGNTATFRANGGSTGSSYVEFGRNTFQNRFIIGSTWVTDHDEFILQGNPLGTPKDIFRLGGADPDTKPLTFVGNAGIRLEGTTNAEKALLAPLSGQIIYNSTDLRWEGYVAAWTPFATESSVPDIVGVGTNDKIPRFSPGSAILENSLIAETTSNTKISFGRAGAITATNHPKYSFLDGSEPTFNRSSSTFEIANGSGLGSLLLIGSDLSGSEVRFRDNAGSLNNCAIVSFNHILNIINNGKTSVNTPADPDTGPVVLGLNAGIALHGATTAERTALTPNVGQVVYDTTESEFYGYNGGWSKFGGGSPGYAHIHYVGNGQPTSSIGTYVDVTGGNLGLTLNATRVANSEIRWDGASGVRCLISFMGSIRTVTTPSAEIQIQLRKNAVNLQGLHFGAEATNTIDRAICGQVTTSLNTNDVISMQIRDNTSTNGCTITAMTYGIQVL